MKDKRNILIIALAVFLMGLGLPAVSSAVVSVFAECAYTDVDFECYIYANTGADELRSGGVKLTYNSAEIINPVATKNDTDWFFADDTGTTYDYPNSPDTSTVEEVVIIVGKLDGEDTGAGVSGPRMEIGTVKFDRVPSAPIPTISLDFGRAPAYVNFVNVAGTDLDAIPGEVGFAPSTILMRGDANEDGQISSADMFKIRTLAGASEFKVYADCNADGSLSSADMFCVRGL